MWVLPVAADSLIPTEIQNGLFFPHYATIHKWKDRMTFDLKQLMTVSAGFYVRDFFFLKKVNWFNCPSRARQGKTGSAVSGSVWRKKAAVTQSPQALCGIFLPPNIRTEGQAGGKNSGNLVAFLLSVSLTIFGGSTWEYLMLLQVWLRLKYIFLLFHVDLRWPHFF